MLVNTIRFGELEVLEEQVITFQQGIPGFEQLHRYTMITPDEELPFKFLQSVEDGGVAFILTNPFWFYTDYEFELSQEAIDVLGVAEPQDVTVWSIVSVTESMASSTINLLAPVVINEKTRLGKQIILHGSGYLTKHLLIQPEPQTVHETASGEEAPHARTDT
ncbi:MAG: flagellar assembly factor FliW [Paenibacillus sp.]|nr:flagellar assembly factor FliW [Paenibacillus sp.]